MIPPYIGAPIIPQRQSAPRLGQGPSTTSKLHAETHTLVGFGLPAFFGLVSPQNLSAAMGKNFSVVQTSYILGPVLAGLLFSFGLGIAPLAFAALGYIWCLNGITLRTQPLKEAAAMQALLHEVAAGITVFWTNPVVFRATVFSMAVALMARPLISMMPAINDHFSLFSFAYFTLLTASFMAGGLVAGIKPCKAQFVSWAGTGPQVDGGRGDAIAGDAFSRDEHVSWGSLFLLGFGCSYVITGNSTILQSKAPEQCASECWAII